MKQSAQGTDAVGLRESGTIPIYEAVSDPGPSSWEKVLRVSRQVLTQTVCVDPGGAVVDQSGASALQPEQQDEILNGDGPVDLDLGFPLHHGIDGDEDRPPLFKRPIMESGDGVEEGMTDYLEHVAAIVRHKTV